MSSLSLNRQGLEDSDVRRALLPPPLLRGAHDPRHLGDAWCVGAAASAAASGAAADWPIRSSELVPSSHAVGGHQIEFVKGAYGQGFSHHTPAAPPKARPLRAELKPPRRELDVVHTIEALRGMRREIGVMRELTLQEIEEFAEVCSPLGFNRSDVLFCRGELSTWFGILLSGQAVAYVPSESGSEVVLGSHGPGEAVGAVRATLWKQSHVRAYTLKASEGGYIATLTYDQLEGLRRARPSLHYVLMRVVLAQLGDAAASFFYGCPLSAGVRWPVVAFHERRVLDFFLRLRDDGKLFVGVDYRALLALSCRVRITQWKARTNIMTRGSPLSAALIVLDGKLTGFRDASAAPSSFFEPGEIVGLEGALGSVRPCSLDVFAARDTLAALLHSDDLADLAREFPSFASQVLQSLYQRLFSGMADPHGPALLLLADGAARVRFAPGDSPALAPGQQRGVPGLLPHEGPTALHLADTTVLRLNGVQSQNDDAVLQQLLGSGAETPGKETLPNRWQIGVFFAEKLASSRALRADQGREARRATFHVAANAAKRGRPVSAPPATSRFHPELHPATRRKPGSSMLADLTKGAAGLDLTATELHPHAPAAPHTAGFRHVLAMSRGAARPWELHRRALHVNGRAPHSPWAVKRASSAPPHSDTGHRAPTDAVERSWRGPCSPGRLTTSSAVACHQCGAIVRASASSSSRTPNVRDPSPSADMSSASYAMPNGAAAGSSRTQKLHNAVINSDGLREGDLQGYFEQQRRFLFDIRGAAVNPEESIAADHHQAWNLKVIAQQGEIEKLRKHVQALEEENRKLRVDQTKVLRDCDEWKACTLRSRLNKEFQGMVESLNVDERRFLRAKCNDSLPDFEKSLRQQLELMETPLSNLSADGISKNNIVIDSLAPPALRTFPRMGGAVVT